MHRHGQTKARLRLLAGRVRGLAVVLGLLLLARGAAAVELEKLVMPGPVAAAHAKTEAECSKCHVAFAKGKQNALCLDCHDKVAADIRGGKGFHGRFRTAATADCSACHSDHKGRDADIVGLDEGTFDHQFTDFPLHDSHGGVACSGCHKQGKPRRDAPSDCFACHKDDDAHKGSLGKDCKACHNEKQWRQGAFDHGKETGYALLGGHARATCGQCHAGQKFKDTPKACIACHRADDVHAGRNGEDCQSCHNVEDWKKSRFNHDRDTRFPLLGAHGKVACDGCHKGGRLHDKLGTDCIACHKADDTHQGRNGTACADCHTEKDWTTVRFDHARSTKFALTGAHAKLECRTCHTGPVETVKLDKACVACHALDDPHKGSLGRDCAACHKDVAWNQGVAFDHDLTRFPLSGLHSVVSCERCHASKDFHGASRDCNGCHKDDDIHKERLGTDCQRCHNPNGWRVWRFDHKAESGFVLDGAHASVECVACHTKPMRGAAKLSQRCGDCHRQDDIHSGAFGADCARCHDTTSFSRQRRTRQ